LRTRIREGEAPAEPDTDRLGRRLALPTEFRSPSTWTSTKAMVPCLHIDPSLVSPSPLIEQTPSTHHCPGNVSLRGWAARASSPRSDALPPETAATKARANGVTGQTAGIEPGRARVAAHAAGNSISESTKLVAIDEDRFETGQSRCGRWPDDDSLWRDRESAASEFGEQECPTMFVESWGIRRSLDHNRTETRGEKVGEFHELIVATEIELGAAFDEIVMIEDHPGGIAVGDLGSSVGV